MGAVLELNQLLPGRDFELTCVNVPKEELVKSRSERIQHLLHPLATVLDDSIGCAIWFAAREAGRSARVAVLGMALMNSWEDTADTEQLLPKVGQRIWLPSSRWILPGYLNGI